MRGRCSILLAVLAACSLLAACGGGEEVGASPAPTTGVAGAEPPATAEPASPPASGAERPPAEPGRPDPPAAGPPAAEPPSAEPPAADALPAPVAETREAIVDAARARDYESLETLLDPATFTYSFGQSGDPVGYWRELEDVGEVPVLGDFLPGILSLRWGRTEDLYVWPAAHAKAPSEWTPQDRADLRTFYTDAEIADFERAGGYLGWRVGIREDGTWLFFVAGD